MPSGALPLDDLSDAARHGNEFARHHDDRHAGLLGADFGDHLHTAPLETRPILHNDLGSAAQLPGRFKLRLRLERTRFSRSASAPWAMARCLDPKISTFFISTLEPHSPTRKDLTLVSRIASIPGQACRFPLR